MEPQIGALRLRSGLVVMPIEGGGLQPLARLWREQKRILSRSNMFRRQVRPDRWQYVRRDRHVTDARFTLRRANFPAPVNPDSAAPNMYHSVLNVHVAAA